MLKLQAQCFIFTALCEKKVTHLSYVLYVKITACSLYLSLSVFIFLTAWVVANNSNMTLAITITRKKKTSLWPVVLLACAHCAESKNNFWYIHTRNDYLLTCTLRTSSCNGIFLNHYECELRCAILLLNHTLGVATLRSQPNFYKVYISATATLLMRFLPAYAWGQIMYYVNRMPSNGTIVSEMQFM